MKNAHNQRQSGLNARTSWPVFLILFLIVGIVLSSCGSSGSTQATVKKPTPTPTATPIPPTATPTPIPPTPTPTFPPMVAPSAVLGVNGSAGVKYPGIPWVRLSYPTCGWTKLSGATLKNTIQSYHAMGTRVMLTICQWSTGTAMYDTSRLQDAAQGGADAVQCGNEQMKYGPFNMYVPPAIFARFYDNCQRIIHTVRPNIPIIIGSMDPQVSDYGALYAQVGYLNSMQYYMNTQVHPGGTWSWRAQIVGLIDSWHNGYPGGYVNNLYHLFSFWAQQIGVGLGNGALGQHLWVIEGTGCFQGCGIDVYSSYAVSISHILTLITDVNTTMQYKVPFFYFDGADFNLNGVLWPMGILDINQHPKPIRQDLWMGARVLYMTCSGGTRAVKDQEQLLASMYAGCSLPGDYVGILES